MKGLKVLLMAVILSACFISGLFADYKTDILNGNKAYKEQKWAEADAWYRKAYKEKPSEKLKNFIYAVEKKIRGNENKTSDFIAPKKQEKPVELGPIFMIVCDVVLAGGAGYMVYYEGNAQEEYNELYATINNTTPANYDLLVKKQKETYLIMTLETAAIGAASAAIIYTLGDIFFTHELFKQDVSLKSGIAPDFAYVKLERSF